MDSNDDIDKGIELIWNNQFQEAEEIFSRKNTVHSRYALHFAEVVYLSDTIYC